MWLGNHFLSNFKQNLRFILQQSQFMVRRTHPKTEKKRMIIGYEPFLTESVSLISSVMYCQVSLGRGETMRFGTV